MTKFSSGRQRVNRYFGGSVQGFFPINLSDFKYVIIGLSVVGSAVVECLTQDRRVAGSSLSGGPVLCY